MDVSDELVAENIRVLHAMQTGVMYDLEHDPTGGTPKHLRVGVNNALNEASAIVKLLVDKGIITGDEFFETVNELLRQEVARYERDIQKRTGAKVILS